MCQHRLQSVKDGFNPARGGQGFNFPPLGAFNVFIFDTPQLSAG